MDVGLFLFFLLTVAFISLTGVLMPGPVFAAAVVKGAQNKHAGAWIALGHLFVEVPLIVLITAGLSQVFQNIWVRAGIGIIGGALLLLMGIQMFRMRKDTDVIKKSFPGHPFVSGIITTVTNPYLYLWWATVGAFLIMSALGFGIIGLFLFIVVHEACDLSWDYFVSYTTFKTKSLWTSRTHVWIFGVFGILLAVFGIYFILAYWMN